MSFFGSVIGISRIRHYHDNATSALLIGDTSLNGCCPIVMLVFRSVFQKMCSKKKPRDST